MSRELSSTEQAIFDAVVARPTATHATIAKSLNLSREHVTRLLGCDALKHRLEEFHVRTLRDAVARACTVSTRMVAELEAIAVDDLAKKSDRITAARAILHFARDSERQREQPFNLAMEAAQAVIEGTRRMRAKLEAEARLALENSQPS
jgi:hypothetical protein